MKDKVGSEIFTSFGLSYPEYEVITPQTKKSYTVRTMTVDEEEVLKGSMMTESKLPRHISQVLWKCLVKKPDDIKTFEDFISKTTIEDRDALLYGLFVSTYKEIHNYSVSCPDCDHENLVKVNLENSLKCEFWDDSKGSILDYRPVADLEIFKDVHCHLKIPTLKDEILTTERNTFSDSAIKNLSVQILRIDKFTQDPSAALPRGDEIKEVSNVIAAYKTLPSKDRKIISDKFADEFSKYQAKVEPKVKCQKCGKMFTINIDITQQFFRSLYQ